MNTASAQPDQMEPDSDAIKMFVGQIPRSMDETDLRKMFEEFGPVHQLNVLRDKVTGQSKGCCFVTFYTRKSALDAQNALHNIKTMAGMQHPIQMKPADSEKRNVITTGQERKLFIGMLSRKTGEQDVRMMFSPFGQIDECTILREQSGESKGCAFVTYSSKQGAMNAIKTMHQSQTMEGCRHPLVVKFADTQKEKEMKKLQQTHANILSNLGGMNPLIAQYLTLMQASQGGGGGGMGGMNNPGNLSNMQQLITAAATAATALQSNPALSATLASMTSVGANSSTSLHSQMPNGQPAQSHSQSSISNAGDAGNIQLQSLAALAAMTSSSNPGLVSNLSPANLNALQQLIAMAAAQQQQQPQSGAQAMSPLHNQGNNSPSSCSGLGSNVGSPTNGAMGGYGQGNLAGAAGGMPAMGSASNGMAGVSQHGQQGGGMDTLSQAYSGIQQYAGLSGLLSQASFPNAFGGQSSQQMQQQQANSPAGKQTEGPEGANLFIYHLPQEFSDHDLLQMFMPFGSVVSAKVFIDKQTNLSKCFGFVSYDNAMSAQQAIQAMNGFQIGMKRLKVQLKRPKNDAKPY